MSTNPDSLSGSASDPEIDFESYLVAMADTVVDSLRISVPVGLPSQERSRRFVLRAAKRLVRGMERAEKGYWPEFLTENDMALLVKHIGWYFSVREGPQ